jgi:hypothetical protein
MVGCNALAVHHRGLELRVEWQRLRDTATGGSRSVASPGDAIRVCYPRATRLLAR